MDRRLKALVLLAAAGAIALFLVIAIKSGLKTRLKTKPHIFLIVIDAARFDLVGQVFAKKEITPAINTFAESACNFSNFYADAPYTTASVASMLTGFLPQVHTVIKPASQLPENITTLAGFLKQTGYFTQAVTGNIILLRHRFLRDFDRVSLIRPLVSYQPSIDGKANEGNHKGCPYTGRTQMPVGAGLAPAPRTSVRGSRGEVTPEKNPRNDKTSFNDIDKAVEIIRELKKDTPHFIYFHLLPPHVPYRPPAGSKRLFAVDESLLEKNPDPTDRAFGENFYRAYLNNAHYADSLVGTILEVLKEKALFADSLVIVTSDHGEAFGEHETFGHGTTVFCEALHVPFLVKLPGQKEKRVIHAHHSLVDLLPSLAALLDIPTNPYWQGRIISFDSPAESNEERFLYALAAGPDADIALFDRRYKYILHAGKDELYDLSSDPDEQHDIASANPALTRRLRQQLFRQLQENLRLKDKLGIKAIDKQLDLDRFKKELKTLGYL